jgi:hypothetical protein
MKKQVKSFGEFTKDRRIMESKELRDSSLDVDSLKANDDIVFLKHEKMRDTSSYYDMPLDRAFQEIIDVFYIDSVQKDGRDRIKLRGHVLAKLIDGKPVSWNKLNLGGNQRANWDEYEEDMKDKYTYKEVIVDGVGADNFTIYSAGSSVDYYEVDDEDTEKIFNKFMEVFPDMNVGSDITDDFRGMGSMSESRKYRSKYK